MSVSPPEKVIYGADDRRDIYQESHPRRRAWANSVCALVHRSRITENADGTYTLATGEFTWEGLPPCEEEPFGDQPVAAFCTGFIVGPNLIATAGHCFDGISLQNTRFVFGFRMLDATSARTTFEANEVYRGVSIVSRPSSSEFDYTIIRVSRTIEAPGAEVLRLRTSGAVADGAVLGTIGHPSGLPLKTSFPDFRFSGGGDNPGYFYARLDAAGASAGSPVFNATGLVEGILARGPEDYYQSGNCFRSAPRGRHDFVYPQVVSRTTPFASIVQPARGTLSLDRSAFACGATINLQLYDLDLAGAGATEVIISATGGDIEIVTLFETETAGDFSGAAVLSGGAVVTGDAIVQAGDGETLIAIYRDADTGRGVAGDATATARVDCTAPRITEVSFDSVGGRHARYTFETSEPAWGAIDYGYDCAALDQSRGGGLATEHAIQLQGLEEFTDYAFTVRAVDTAGNEATADRDGSCFTFTTYGHRDYLTQTLSQNNPEEAAELSGRSVTFTPDDSISGYSACLTVAEDFPVSPACGEHIDFRGGEHTFRGLSGGHVLTYFGENYTGLNIGQDGYISFESASEAFEPLLESHFALPRISGLFADILPGTGEIRFAELDDRIAVTYHSVFHEPYEFPSSFQIEVFYTGEIRITWLAVSNVSAIAGLSSGYQLERDFEQSVLSAYPECTDPQPAPVFCESTVENDFCADAIPMTPREVYGGYFHGATGSAGLPGCEDCQSPDIWYRFTPVLSGEYVFWNYFGYAVLDIYMGDCGNLEALDWFGSSEGIGIIEEETIYRRGIPVRLTAGTTYWVRAASYGGTTGPIALEVDFGAKGSFGCNAGSGAPGNPLTEVLLLAGVVMLLAWRARERRA